LENVFYFTHPNDFGFKAIGIKLFKFFRTIIIIKHIKLWLVVKTLVNIKGFINEALGSNFLKFFFNKGQFKNQGGYENFEN